MSQPLRIGIVGCGNIAQEHAAGYHRGGAKVAWVYDVNPAAAQKLAVSCGAEVAPSIEAMARPDRIDAASVCTPAMLHLPTALPLVEAGIPVLCEKPLEGDLPRAEELAAAVRRAGSLFMVAFCHRFHAPVIEMHKLVRSGALGEPVFFRNMFGTYFDAAKTSHVDPKLAGSGAMSGNGIHSIDLFRHLVGEPTRVQAMGGTVLHDVPVEDLGAMVLSAGDKAFGQITSSYALHGVPGGVEWYGSQGVAIASYWQPGVRELRYRRAGETEWTGIDCADRPDRFTAEIAHFLDCVRRGETPSVTVEDGLIAQRVLDAAYRSIRGGGVAISDP